MMHSDKLKLETVQHVGLSLSTSHQHIRYQSFVLSPETEGGGGREREEKKKEEN